MEREVSGGWDRAVRGDQSRKSNKERGTISVKGSKQWRNGTEQWEEGHDGNSIGAGSVNVGSTAGNTRTRTEHSTW